MTPLERAARALCRGNPDDLVRHPQQVQKNVGEMRSHIPTVPRWHLHLADARDVLWAIRQPSEVMKQVSPSSGQVLYPEDFWVAMIDAALKEG